MDNKAPTQQVDVLVAAFKAEATIARAVKSALAQPETARVIVVDDASPDATVETARACDDGSGRLVVLTQVPNQGPASARNLALHRGTAPWVTVLDADDAMQPGRLGQLLRHADNGDLIADELLVVVKGREQDQPKPMFSPSIAHPQSIDTAQFIRGNITHGRRDRQDLGYVKPLMRRSFLETHGIVYPVGVRLGEDFILYATALLQGARLILVPAAGYLYTISPNSLSGNHSVKDLEALYAKDKSLLELAGSRKLERKAIEDHRHGLDAKIQWLRLIDAVKTRHLMRAIGTLRSPKIALYLVQQLAREGARRMGRTTL